MAGYSGTPLARKLGIKDRATVALMAAPAGFERAIDGLPDSVSVHRDPRGRCSFDVIVLFVTDQSALRKRFAAAAKLLQENGGLWVAWPKKASGIITNVDENAVRRFGLDAGLVDNKVCAIDEIWSAHRFVIRIADRKPK